MDFDACSEVSNNPSLVVSEKGRKFRLDNAGEQRLRKVLVDGCLITDDRPRCDYLIEIGEPCRCVIYLELKGCHVDDAYKQLTATMGYLNDYHKNFKRICHVVASRVPRSGPAVQVLKRRMMKAHRVMLHVGTKEVTVKVADAIA
jgi:hypothetical protein